MISMDYLLHATSEYHPVSQGLLLPGIDRHLVAILSTKPHLFHPVDGLLRDHDWVGQHQPDNTLRIPWGCEGPRVGEVVPVVHG